MLLSKLPIAVEPTTPDISFPGARIGFQGFIRAPTRAQNHYDYRAFRSQNTHSPSLKVSLNIPHPLELFSVTRPPIRSAYSEGQNIVYPSRGSYENSSCLLITIRAILSVNTGVLGAVKLPSRFLSPSFENRDYQALCDERDLQKIIICISVHDFFKVITNGCIDQLVDCLFRIQKATSSTLVASKLFFKLKNIARYYLIDGCQYFFKGRLYPRQMLSKGESLIKTNALQDLQHLIYLLCRFFLEQHT